MRLFLLSLLLVLKSRDTTLIPNLAIGYFRVACCRAIDMKMIFYSHANKLIFTRNVVHLALSWKWEFLELRSSLFTSNRISACSQSGSSLLNKGVFQPLALALSCRLNFFYAFGDSCTHWKSLNQHVSLMVVCGISLFLSHIVISHFQIPYFLE